VVNECTIHNNIVFVPKIVKVGGNLTVMPKTILIVFFETR